MLLQWRTMLWTVRQGFDSGRAVNIFRITSSSRIPWLERTKPEADH